MIFHVTIIHAAMRFIFGWGRAQTVWTNLGVKFLLLVQVARIFILGILWIAVSLIVIATSQDALCRLPILGVRGLAVKLIHHSLAAKALVDLRLV